MVTDTPPSSHAGTVIPLEHAPSVRKRPALTDESRHDNPHWPTRSPEHAANALLLHGGCAWHCSTKVAALLVSRNDYQYFRDRGWMEGNAWAPSLSDC
ncbi:hypothetical protein IU449_23175 [Nocardia higoensis]|uniref:Uncharacterized protein n=1 Tax=Nocardia higoensis TaxID=228599 RepID=A0ABS0DG14_9NOCA|nr:hypothetical protein [Nocardia higoensis]MBF6357414.1 hypothetical protein [Nocardia higoensis]